jgi:lipopolysaccharide/colanic/teichoic acid biosynthesis glycosyltransferase
MREQISNLPRQSEHGAEGSGEISRLQPLRRWYLPIKGLADFLGACVLGVILLPVVLIAVVLVKLTSRGPAFYLQTRVGKNGRPFTLIKLRTMVHNAEALTGPVWATTNDSRVTLLGRYLRDLHIDEFPQLVNVLAGQMSLIGPRPERPEFVSRLEWVIRDYRERLNVRPGISGLAQLKLPPDSDIDSVRRKLTHDLYYVRHVSPVLDAKLLFFTGGLLLVKSIRGIVRYLGLPSNAEIESHLEVAAQVYQESPQRIDSIMSAQGDPAPTQI